MTGDARALLGNWLLGNLDQNFLARLQQLGNQGHRSRIPSLEPGAAAVVASAPAALPVKSCAPLRPLLRQGGSAYFHMRGFSVGEVAIGFEFRFLLNRFQFGVLLLLHLELFRQLLGSHHTFFQFFVEHAVLTAVRTQALLADLFFQFLVLTMLGNVFGVGDHVGFFLVDDFFFHHARRTARVKRQRSQLSAFFATGLVTTARSDFLAKTTLGNDLGSSRVPCERIP